jgi:hypothetical protein
MLTVADFTKAKSVDVVQIFVFEKYTAANMLFPTDKGNRTYEVAKLQMLDKVNSCKNIWREKYQQLNFFLE